MGTFEHGLAIPCYKTEKLAQDDLSREIKHGDFKTMDFKTMESCLVLFDYELV